MAFPSRVIVSFSLFFPSLNSGNEEKKENLKKNLIFLKKSLDAPVLLWYIPAAPTKGS